MRLAIVTAVFDALVCSNAVRTRRKTLSAVSLFPTGLTSHLACTASAEMEAMQREPMFTEMRDDRGVVKVTSSATEIHQTSISRWATA